MYLFWCLKPHIEISYREYKKNPANVRQMGVEHSLNKNCHNSRPSAITNHPLQLPENRPLIAKKFNN